jgi:hypothetical protein
MKLAHIAALSVVFGLGTAYLIDVAIEKNNELFVATHSCIYVGWNSTSSGKRVYEYSCINPDTWVETRKEVRVGTVATER